MEAGKAGEHNEKTLQCLWTMTGYMVLTVLLLAVNGEVLSAGGFVFSENVRFQSEFQREENRD